MSQLTNKAGTGSPAFRRGIPGPRSPKTVLGPATSELWAHHFTQGGNAAALSLMPIAAGGRKALFGYHGPERRDGPDAVKSQSNKTVPRPSRLDVLVTWPAPPFPKH